MDFHFEPLDELEYPIQDRKSNLPHFWELLSIPRLADKPQNPILGTVERLRRPESYLNALPEELVSIIRTSVAGSKDVEDVTAILQRLSLNSDSWEHKGRILSWDTLYDSSDTLPTLSPYLTENSPSTTNAARHRALPRFIHPHERIIYMDTNELLASLSLLLSGDSSKILLWDENTERFMAYKDENEQVRIALDGMDEVVCESYINKYIKMGSGIRRLDHLTAQLRRKKRKAEPITSGFTHALSSVLAWIRGNVADAISKLQISGSDRICALWTLLQEYDSLISALCTLCYRSYEQDPSTYPSLPESPINLISHIYNNLASSIDRGAIKRVCASLAYILTVTSRPYFKDLSEAIGLYGIRKILEEARLLARKRLDESESAFVYTEDDDDLEGDFDSSVGDFPIFVSDDYREAVHRARKSIKILASPEIDNAFPLPTIKLRKLEWVWTQAEISKLADSSENQETVDRDSTVPCEECAAAELQFQKEYKPELAEFAKFDLEPGAMLTKFAGAAILERQEVNTFIKNFPLHLPPYTPTLSLLSDSVMKPILAQTSILGRTSLRIFLTPKSSLHFRAHLVLLRSYLMLTAPAFKARLSAALFSDAIAEDDDAEENPMGVTIRTRDRNTNWRAVRRRTDPVEARTLRVKTQPWAVGLSFGLTDRAQWPPVGSDLAFYLRRVIMDSLEEVRAAETMFASDDLGNDEFWNEGENRIGFAIRDFPKGKGRERWMDPTLIEALDFLYMDYKPPRPLRSLITLDIISKYQRIFAFLLRLLRVEHATRVLYRLTRPAVISVFLNEQSILNVVNHFRFSAETFISVLSAYTADTAIRGNIDAFIARIKSAESNFTDIDSEPVLSVKGDFADVYALMKRHSRVLDDILAACLLRGTQQAVSQLLHSILEIILEFANIVGNVHKGLVQETAAAERLNVLHHNYKRKIAQMIKTLRKIDAQNSRGITSNSIDRERQLPRAPGGQEALSDLLVRMANMGINDNLLYK